MAGKNRDHVYRQPHYAGDTFHVRPTFCVSIPEFVHTTPRTGKQHRMSLRNLQQNRHKGDVSQKAQSKIKNAVNWLIQASKPKRVWDRKSGKTFTFRVNFVTLSIPQLADSPSDNIIKRDVFHPFIVYLRKYCGLRNYVWRAEAQVNGMIHFHLLTDTFLHWRKIRTVWNRKLQKCGLLADFIARYGHSDPNSTDVHSVKGILNLGAYIAKYVSKKDATRRSITGRLWGCNYELSHERKTSASLDPGETADLLRHFDRIGVQWKSIEGKPDAMGNSRRVGTLHTMTESAWRSIKHTLLGQAYFSRIFEIRSNTVTMPIEYYTINQEQCLSITQSTPATGILKSAQESLKKQIGNVRNAVSQIKQLGIDFQMEHSSMRTNTPSVGVSGIP